MLLDIVLRARDADCPQMAVAGRGCTVCASWRGESPVTGIMARDSNEPDSVILGGESSLNCALELGLGLGLTTMASATNLGNQKCTPAPTAMLCAPIEASDSR